MSCSVKTRARRKKEQHISQAFISKSSKMAMYLGFLISKISTVIYWKWPCILAFCLTQTIHYYLRGPPYQLAHYYSN